MPVMFRLKLKREDAEEVDIACQFSDEEHESLQAYLQQHLELIESKPLRDGLLCSMSIDWSKEEGLRVTAQLPTNDDLAILLHRLRPFILEEERASFIRVCAILGRNLIDQHIRRLLNEQRELYDGRDMQRQIRIATEEVVVNSDRTLKDWLNSYEYHRDLDKRQAVAHLLERMPGDLLRGIFVSMLIDRIKAIGNLAALIGLVIGKTNELEFKVSSG